MTDEKVKAIRGGEPSSDASVSASPAADETTLGHVIWHSSDEDGGPDVGLSLGLGKGRMLWLGEMSNRALEEAEIDLSRYSDGWWLTLYQPGRTTIIGAIPDSYEARNAFDEIAAAVRSAAGQPLTGKSEDGSSQQKDDALQAERDKLSAEVERLKEIIAKCNNSLFGSYGFFEECSGKDQAQAIEDLKSLSNQRWRDKQAAEAKLTALVRALTKIAESNESARQREYALNALAHHSAPVGEAGKTVLNAEASEVFVTALAEPPEPNAALWKAAAQHHLRALLFAARTSGGASGPDDYLMGVCARAEAFMVSAPPSTPTSAPVEDVGGLTEEHARDAGRELYGVGYHDGFVDGYLIGKGEDSYPDADDLREIIMQADSENVSDGWANARDAFLAALIQPQGEEP